MVPYLRGTVFTRLTVLAIDIERSIRRAHWVCICRCGKIVSVASSALRAGLTKSCGCLKRERSQLLGKSSLKHGARARRTPTYRSWAAMRDRCLNPNATGYRRWGGRGIKPCPEWTFFENFLNDMGERPSGTTLDRIDNNLGYYKANCRWATSSQQNKNRSMPWRK